MGQNIIKVSNPAQKEAIAKEILEQLPEWFGLPDSTAEYIRGVKELPFFACMEAGNCKGFLALKETSAYTTEIYVMGVKKEYHKQKIGTQLFEAAHTYAREKGYEFMQVKTVQKGHYAEYDISNAFYVRMGFRELECLTTLWDEWNPCQIYVRSV